MFRLKPAVLLLICAGPSAFVLRAEARTWTDATGKFSVEADFVSLEGNTVRLKKTNGAEISVPLEKLSRADQEFVRAATAPKTPAKVFKVADPDAILAELLSDGATHEVDLSDYFNNSVTNPKVAAQQEKEIKKLGVAMRDLAIDSGDAEIQGVIDALKQSNLMASKVTLRLEKKLPWESVAGVAGAPVDLAGAPGAGELTWRPVKWLLLGIEDDQIVAAKINLEAEKK